ncbi:MAG TPA: PmoA family protein [Phycisphaerae bacterium]|nr:PmoA family protein [Phycisphaerae bacterium]HRR84378.1 PmoA family protein [Phycisphaerae bacterium]
MNAHTDRRSLLKQTLAGAGAALLAGRSAAGADTHPDAAGNRSADDEPAAAPEFSAYAFGANIWVRIDNRVFTCYRANADQKYPYLYPLTGPATGLSMTDETCEPWPHHRSVFFGCDRVNGANYWQEGNDRGQIVSRGPKLEPLKGRKDASAPGGVTITDICDWRVPGQSPVIEDRRRYTISAPSRDLRLLDVDITVTAKVDIHISRTNHSLFGIRAARELAPVGGGMLINSKGQIGEKATFGQPANWCGYQGRRLGIVESIVVMDHPNNPWAPDCPWFTRDYGNISPTPFLWIDEQKGWDLPVGKSIRMLYRVVVTKGEIEQAAMDRLWEAFAKAEQA